MKDLLLTRKVQYFLLILAALPMIRLAAADDAAFRHWNKMTDQELDSERGGFTTKDGFISFGIERAIYINSELQLRSIYGQDLPAVVPNGNVAGFSDVLSPLTIVQNSLDNQLIQNVTTINATVANMNIYRQMNFSSMLNQQLLNMLR